MSSWWSLASWEGGHTQPITQTTSFSPESKNLIFTENIPSLISRWNNYTPWSDHFGNFAGHMLELYRSALWGWSQPARTNCNSGTHHLRTHAKHVPWKLPPGGWVEVFLFTFRKTNMEPNKLMVCRCFPFSKEHFWGSMFVFGEGNSTLPGSSRYVNISTVFGRYFFPFWWI